MKSKILEDFPNYVIYSNGDIVSTKHGKNKLLKQQTKRGYLSVSIANKNGKSIQILSHRLIAMAFIDNPENKKQVNHKDRNRKNNDISNLEWCTSFENMAHYELTRSTPIHNKKYVLDIVNGIYYDSAREATKLLGYKENVLHQYLNGRAKNKTNLRYA